MAYLLCLHQAFFNHESSPNCCVHSERKATRDGVAVFCIADIKIGEECTINYRADQVCIDRELRSLCIRNSWGFEDKGLSDASENLLTAFSESFQVLKES